MKKRTVVSSVVSSSNNEVETAREVLLRLFQACGVKTNTDFAAILGITQTSVSKAKTKGRIPADWIVTIGHRSGYSLDWLCYGVGPKLRQDMLATDSPNLGSGSKPVILFGPANLQDWSVKIKTSLSVSCPPDISLGDDSFAVIIPGFPIVAKSRPSSIFFCDPDVSPVDGQLVYLERRDNLVVVGTFWSDKKDYVVDVVRPTSTDQPQEPISLTINRELVVKIASVAFVRDSL
jgi:hypothetical protein